LIPGEDLGQFGLLRQLFRLWLGVTEYLFRNPDLLDEAIDTAIDDNTFRSDDLEFTFAARVSATRSPILVIKRRRLLY
jgi:glutamine synthetase adenylyltransferase